MITYRPFRNTDPPQLLQLWDAAHLGRGAASQFTTDAFEYFVFAQPYFDARGLILATDRGRVIGFTHATPGVNDDESALGTDLGAVIALLVHPDYRGQGIGRRLMQLGRQYLTDRGVTRQEFGPSERTNAFYVGLYGGSQPCGFLRSDESLSSFATHLGCRPVTQYRAYQKDLNGTSRGPMTSQIITNRRKTELVAGESPADQSWWWQTRFGRLDSVRFCLLEKASGRQLAAMDVYGLDLYIPRWGQRGVGLGPLQIADADQGHGYELSLLLEASKYLREQLITLLDISVRDADIASIELLEKAGFEQVDAGTVYSLATAEDLDAAAGSEAASSVPGLDDTAEFVL